MSERAGGFLLDSHALIWWLTASERLGHAARAAISGDDPVWVSAASVWEIATKSRLGKLTEIVDFKGQYASLVERNRFRRLPITDGHAMVAGTLEGAHRDPFDRLLAAQALVEELTVLTRNHAISGFGCKVLW